jgi:redox-sensitive bicupin YhaK (pirin superfamily)
MSTGEGIIGSMSGPVDVADTPAQPTIQASDSPAQTTEVIDGRATTVGDLPVRRVLPRRGRRTVGAWCFADHMGPVEVDEFRTVEIGPHPHIGLHTVTWLVAGELLHRDSIGSEQPIRPGQLNLMTAGHGVAHAEEATNDYRGDLHGMQLWVAQPEDTRHGAPAFEHHAELPQVRLGAGEATVLVGEFDGVTSPARRDTDLVGLDAVLRAGVSSWALRTEFEYAVVVIDGAVAVDDTVVTPGQLGYLGLGRDELTVSTTENARMLLLGGVPFEESVLIWWNYVARSKDEVELAGQDWNAQAERFGRVDSTLARIASPIPPWKTGPS